jgi:hypothetical protein
VAVHTLFVMVGGSGLRGFGGTPYVPGRAWQGLSVTCRRLSPSPYIHSNIEKRVYEPCIFVEHLGGTSFLKGNRSSANCV